jgi:hypothetical protein
MNHYLRAGIVGAGSCALLLVGTPPALAQSFATSVQYNGAIKATATYNQNWWQMCANLHAGYSATASMDGNSVTDYSADGLTKCIQVNSTDLGRQYTLTITWRGTGGATKQNSTVVIA